MIDKTPFEKVTEMIQLRLTMGHNVENGGRAFGDNDGETVAFEDGKVYLKDGEWYERQYAPLNEIFAVSQNVVSYLDSVSDRDKVNTFIDWRYGRNMNGGCPVKYTDIVPTGIQAESEMRIEPDFRDLSKKEIKSLMIFSKEQLAAIEAFEKAGRDLLKNNIRLLFSTECYSLNYFNAENAVENRIGSMEDLEAYIPDEDFDPESVVEVSSFCKPVLFSYGDYYDGAYAIFKDKSK